MFNPAPVRVTMRTTMPAQAQVTPILDIVLAALNIACTIFFKVTERGTHEICHGGIFSITLCYRNSVMLLIGTTPLTLGLNLVKASGGMFGLGAAMIGYCLAPMSWWERILFAIAGLMLIDPAIVADIVGVSILVLGLLYQWRKNQSMKAQQVS